uniref:Uncharacterized protein n=1 Tax=Angiostrongylus cantonensis TaxID=6313 RepID=A0A0K0DDJ1_ANGCA
MCFQQCFYCGGTTERCLPYAWYFPGCELNDVRHNKCWGKSIKNRHTINKSMLIFFIGYLKSIFSCSRIGQPSR